MPRTRRSATQRTAREIQYAAHELDRLYREACEAYRGPGPGAVVTRQWTQKGPNGPETWAQYSDGSIWPTRLDIVR